VKKGKAFSTEFSEGLCETAHCYLNHIKKSKGEMTNDTHRKQSKFKEEFCDDFAISNRGHDGLNHGNRRSGGTSRGGN
jgi:hypothetical protein